MRALLRGALAAACITGSLAAGISTATAAVTIGQTGPVSGLCSQNQDWAQRVVTSGTPYIVPSIPPATSLSITSWSHFAHSNPNQQIKFRVYRPVMGLTYQVVAQDVHSLTPSVLNTFSADVRVQPGDILGISNGPDTPNMGCGTGAFSETDLSNNTSNTPPGLALGDQVTFVTIGGSRLDVSAVVEPTSRFTIGATTRNKKKGTATLAVDVPNPGELTVSGSGFREAAAVTATSVPAAGAVLLKIKATGKKLKKLRRKGKVKVSPSITFTPTGGSSSTQSTQLKLKLNLKKR
jgi:hypothetical protein